MKLFWILFALFPTLAQAESTFQKVKAFFPEGAYRKTSGGESCLDGNVAWQGEMMVFGSGASPVLIHSFDNPKMIPKSEDGDCATKTATTVTSKKSKNTESLKITQKVAQDCGKGLPRKMNYELSGKRHDKKIELHLTITDGVKLTPTACSYEKSL